MHNECGQHAHPHPAYSAGTIAGGAIAASTSGVVTLALGKAFIQVCKAAKMGKLSEADITSSKGVNMLKKEFRAQLKKK